MMIHPLTIAGLVSLPKQCLHVNQLTYVFGLVVIFKSFINDK